MSYLVKTCEAGPKNLQRALDECVRAGERVISVIPNTSGLGGSDVRELMIVVEPR